MSIRIYANDELIHDSDIFDDYSHAISEVTCDLELGEPGTMSFTIYANHPKYYDTLPMETFITLEYDGDEIFRGVVDSVDISLELSRKIKCKGDLQYLEFASPMEVLPQWVTKDEYFLKLMNAYNNFVGDTYAGDKKKLFAGRITIPNLEYSTFDKEQEANSTCREHFDKLIEENGGYLATRREEGVVYLDYLDIADCVRDNPECEIHYGINLMTLEINSNARDIFTVLVPKNKYFSIVGTEANEYHIASNDGFLEWKEGIEKYGRIIAVIDHDDAPDPNALLRCGMKDMETMFEKIRPSYEVTCLEPHYFDNRIPKIRIGDRIRLISEPHDLDDNPICTAIAYDFESPDKTKYTFGTPTQEIKNEKLAVKIGRRIDEMKRDNQKLADEVASYRRRTEAVNDRVSSIIDKMNSL